MKILLRIVLLLFFININTTSFADPQCATSPPPKRQAPSSAKVFTSKQRSFFPSNTTTKSDGSGVRWGGAYGNYDEAMASSDPRQKAVALALNDVENKRNGYFNTGRSYETTSMNTYLEDNSRNYAYNSDNYETDVSRREEPKYASNRKRTVEEALDAFEESNEEISDTPVPDFLQSQKPLKSSTQKNVQYDYGKYRHHPGQIPPNEPSDFALGFHSGYRIDDLTWNIAGDISGADPNISLEQEYSSIRMPYFLAEANMNLVEAFRFEGKLGYGSSLSDGYNRESEYLSDNGEDEFLRSENKVSEASAFDASMAFGYNVVFEPKFGRDNLDVDRLSLTPLVGYSFHRQDMTVTDGDQTIDFFNFFGLGPFEGLKNTYTSWWNGPWLGVELSGQAGRVLSSLRYERHWAKYSAEGDYNLRTDLEHPASYEHETDGTGHVFNVGLGYKLTDNWQLDLNYLRHMWRAEAGTDRLNMVDGTRPETQLNEVEWDSQQFFLGATRSFY